jgi:hypothetical protein
MLDYYLCEFDYDHGFKDYVYTLFAFLIKWIIYIDVKTCLKQI